MTSHEVLTPLKSVGMIYTPLTRKALALCCDAHKGQLDKSGIPYLLHPFHVAEQMDSEYEVCTALLHDVVEDTHYTFEDLERAGFPAEVMGALRLLTHDLSVPYLDYIRALRADPLAVKVKLADLIHNSTTSRLEVLTPEQEEKVLEYQEAIRILLE